MRKFMAIAVAALTLTACDPDITEEEMATVTETVVETEVVTQTADPVIITRNTERQVLPDHRQAGPAAMGEAHYNSYAVNAEALECWQAREGIHIKTAVTSNVDQVVDVSGTVEVIDMDGRSLGRGSLFVPDMFPGDTVEALTFIGGVRAEEFNCRYVLFETLTKFEGEPENIFLDD